jgi:hypothetical protein
MRLIERYFYTSSWLGAGVFFLHGDEHAPQVEHQSADDQVRQQLQRLSL